MPLGESGGGLGPQLAGERITVNRRVVSVVKQLGEGGFSFVYLVKDTNEGIGATPTSSVSPSDATTGTNGSGGSANRTQQTPQLMVLKITSIHSRQQRDIAEKEAKLLSRLSHPSIVKMVDACYRTHPVTHSGGGIGGIIGGGKGSDHGQSSQGASPTNGRPQHMILMEYCEGGHALDVCNRMSAAGRRFDLPSLIIAFGQICNAVSYLHAQRPPIVHRDLKPVNFLVKNGAYKLCDFGSAVFGHVELKTAKQRAEAQEAIEKTTTQMFRAPEMVDLYMAKKLTQSTDVWALGCCLYSLAFFQNCFEEGSNLAILSRNYKIPEDNPYGDGLVELIDRMLTVEYKARADMTEVILCLSAIYSGRPLPPRKKVKKKKTEEKTEGNAEKVGTFRTDGQGIRTTPAVEPKKPVEAKKLNPNSAAARRRRAAQTGGSDSPTAGTNANAPVFFTSDAYLVDSKATASRPGVQDSGAVFEASFSDLFAFKGQSQEESEADGFNMSDNPFTNAAGNSFDGEADDKDDMFRQFETDSPSAKSPSSNANDETFGSDEAAAFPAFDSVGSTSGGFGDVAFPGFEKPEEAKSAKRGRKSPNAFTSAAESSSAGSESRSSSVDLAANEMDNLDVSGAVESGGSKQRASSIDTEDRFRGRRRSIGNPLSHMGSSKKGPKSPDSEPKKKGGIKGILNKGGSFRKGKVDV